MQVLRAYTVAGHGGRDPTREVITTGATAAELLAQLGLTYDDNDLLTPAADETVTGGQQPDPASGWTMWNTPRTW